MTFPAQKGVYNKKKNDKNNDDKKNDNKNIS
jgi:hypothetical protein